MQSQYRCLALTMSMWVVLAVLSAREVFPQITAGAVRGMVSDTSGAALPAVEVVGTHLATNLSFSTNTTEAGSYVLGNLPVGEYRISAQKVGFKQVIQERVYVVTATTTSLDFRMEVGELAQQITVEESVAPLIQTDNAEVSSVLDNRTVMDLPLSLGGASQTAASGRRQAENFVFLTPGVTGDQFSKSFNGSTDLSQGVIIEGLPHNVPVTPGFIAQTSPPFEALEEFKVSSTLYPAEAGRGFGVTNYTLKSGTNNYHGNVFWFLRNDKFDARGFFNPVKPIVRQNDYGFTVGGPIIKGKTFFFGAWNGFKLRGGSPIRGFVTVPTEAFRRGDFSQLVDPGTGQLIQIYDPATTRPDGSGGFTRDPFLGNIIPTNRISPIARKVFDFLPPPDLPGIVNNFVNRSNIPVNDDVITWKLDHSFNPSHKVSYSHWWAYQNADYLYGGPLGKTEMTLGYPSPVAGGGLRVNYDWVVSPRVLNHFAVGYSQSNPRRGLDARKGNQILQIPGIPADIPGFPAFLIPGIPKLGNAGEQPNDPSKSEDYLFSDSVSIARGKHQFKFGGEYWYEKYSNFGGTQGGGLGGTLSFSNLETSLPNSPSFGQLGSGTASFLLGQVDSAQRLVGAKLRTINLQYLALFVEDKLQLAPRLTLSLGLRWELPKPYRDNDPGRMSMVDLIAPNPGAGGRPGAYVFGTDLVVPPLDKREFAPRLGLSYQLNPKTVLRTGFGIIYSQTNAHGLGSYQFGNAFEAGFSDIFSVSSLNSGITPAFILDQGFPPFTGQLPYRDPALKNGQVGDYMSGSGGKQAYQSAWQLSIQRELPKSIFLDIAYVGNKGTHLPANLENFNQVPSRYLSLGALLNQPIGSPAAQAAGISAPYPGFTGTVAQALRPFPQYASINNAVQPIGNSSYHSMQLKLQKRFSGGLSYLVSYTLSKTLTDTSLGGYSVFNAGARDTANRSLEKALAGNDRTRNLVTSWIYELPGKQLTGVRGKVAKGWQVGIVTRYTSGVPLSISGGGPLPIFGGGNRPNRVPGVSARSAVSGGSFDPARDVYLNAQAFQQPAPFTFGTGASIEPDLRGFTFRNEDLSIIKRTYISNVSEVFNVEFRAELFNVFNRTIFSNPATNVNSPTTFGIVGGQANLPRNIQFGIKINF